MIKYTYHKIYHFNHSFFFFFFFILKSLILTCVPKHEPASHLPPFFSFFFLFFRLYNSYLYVFEFIDYSLSPFLNLLLNSSSEFFILLIVLFNSRISIWLFCNFSLFIGVFHLISHCFHALFKHGFLEFFEHICNGCFEVFVFWTPTK